MKCTVLVLPPGTPHWNLRILRGNARKTDKYKIFLPLQKLYATFTLSFGSVLIDRYVCICRIIKVERLFLSRTSRGVLRIIEQ